MTGMELSSNRPPPFLSIVSLSCTGLSPGLVIAYREGAAGAGTHVGAFVLMVNGAAPVLSSVVSDGALSHLFLAQSLPKGVDGVDTDLSRGNSRLQWHLKAEGHSGPRWRLHSFRPECLGLLLGVGCVLATSG